MAVALALLASVTACAKVEAKTPAPIVLDAPTPPPRVVVPVTLPPAPPPDVAPAIPQPSTPASTPHPITAPPPVTTPAKPADKPAPAAETPVAPLASDVLELEKRTQTLLGDAQRDLDRVVPATLNLEARAQYEQARRFVAQAQDALKKKQYFYAQGLAEKAATLASQLPKGRRQAGESMIGDR